jgi:hypothetical protein
MLKVIKNIKLPINDDEGECYNFLLSGTYIAGFLQKDGSALDHDGNLYVGLYDNNIKKQTIFYVVKTRIF